MNPLNVNAPCPKCGHDDVRMIYVQTHTSWESYPACGLSSNAKYREHIDRVCQRCRYGWAEEPLAPRTEEPQ